MQPLLPYFSCRTGRIAHHHQGIRIDFSYLLHKHTSGNNYKIKMRPNVSRRKQSICRTTFLIQQLCRSLLPCPLIPKGGTKSLIRAHLLKESSKNIGAGFENLRKYKKKREISFLFRKVQFLQGAGENSDLRAYSTVSPAVSQHHILLLTKGACESVNEDTKKPLVPSLTITSILQFRRTCWTSTLLFAANLATISCKLQPEFMWFCFKPCRHEPTYVLSMPACESVWGRASELLYTVHYTYC